MASGSYNETLLLQCWPLQRPKSSQYGLILWLMRLVSPLKTFCREYRFFLNSPALRFYLMSSSKEVPIQIRVKELCLSNIRSNNEHSCNFDHNKIYLQNWIAYSTFISFYNDVRSSIHNLQGKLLSHFTLLESLTVGQVAPLLT